MNYEKLAKFLDRIAGLDVDDMERELHEYIAEHGDLGYYWQRFWQAVVSSKAFKFDLARLNSILKLDFIPIWGGEPEDWRWSLLTLLLERNAEPDEEVLRRVAQIVKDQGLEALRAWSGKPAMGMAVKDHHSKPWILETLIEVGYDPNITMELKEGKPPITPLGLVDQNIDMAMILLAAGADPNVLDAYNYEPILHKAVEYTPALARLLLEAGADPLIQDSRGKMPIDVCKDGFQKTLRKYILRRLNNAAQHGDIL